ncbi:MAG: NAD(P)-dependent oxidoreductase [Alphaproteobacteria bacterium]|nr:NAD(P)-dependent oxidoreductase [Alphaproteobacteria bacterium]
MKVALIGATGNAGSRILEELVRRGHSITAITRNPERMKDLPCVVAKQGDANNVADLAPLLTGHDAVVSSLHFMASDPHKLIAAVKQAGVKRYLVVGGAGGLEVEPGVRVIDTEHGVPEPYRPESRAGIAFLDELQATQDLDWTFLSPSEQFVAGERTGVFRLGSDALLRDESGRSWISYEDYAVALVDELQTPSHSGRRFTVGY